MLLWEELTIVLWNERQDTQEILLGSTGLVDGMARVGWKSHLDAQSGECFTSVVGSTDLRSKGGGRMDFDLERNQREPSQYRAFR